MIEAKLKGRMIAAKPVAPQVPVVDLMAALKRSLKQETESASKPKSGATTTKPKRKAPDDRRQSNLLLPVAGGAGSVKQSRPEPVAGAGSRDKGRRTRDGEYDGPGSLSVSIVRLGAGQRGIGHLDPP